MFCAFLAVDERVEEGPAYSYGRGPESNCFEDIRPSFESTVNVNFEF